jgi:Na+-transporting NADH:ubiquinone oxidoreductase subunit B
MNFIKNIFEKTKPYVQKGAKYQWLHSTHESFFSLFFVQKNTSKSGVHIHDYIDLKRTMTVVIIALLPALLFGSWNIGYQHGLAFGIERGIFANFLFGFLKMLPLIIVSYVVGLGIEFASAQIRGHEVNEGFLVSGLLIPMIVPINIPLWMLALAVAFAVIFGKEIFGGTGYNIMNVALIARAFLFFAYPSQMSGDKVWIYNLTENTPVDGFSGATPLGQLAQGVTVDKIHSFKDMFMGFMPGSIGETSTIAILIGAFILIVTRIGSWKIMLSTVLGTLVIGGLCNMLALNSYMEVPAYYHLVMGGFAFGAVFMATDPVTASNTEKGKWIYGFMIGALAVLIRIFNPAYPEGMMLAILLMNVWAPLVDYFVVESHIKRRLKRAKVKANI